MNRPRHRDAIVALIVLSIPASARAALTASYDGQLVGKKLAQSLAVSAALSDLGGGAVSGTIAVAGDLSGAYLVNGTATAKRLKLKGSVGGATLVWKAKILGDTLQGKARLKGAAAKLVATLTLQRNPPLGNGTGCDAVFTQNRTFFEERVLGDALVSCTACHVPGGQADASRFHVSASDALATARAIVPFVDGADPATSRILRKPLALVPHGGEQQIVPGSEQAQALEQWVALVAAAGCE